MNRALSAREKAGLRGWAGHLHNVFAADSASEGAHLLNQLLDVVVTHPYLTDHGGRLHLHYAPAEADPLHRVQASTAMGLAIVRAPTAWPAGRRARPTVKACTSTSPARERWSARRSCAVLHERRGVRAQEGTGGDAASTEAVSPRRAGPARRAPRVPRTPALWPYRHRMNGVSDRGREGGAVAAAMARDGSASLVGRRDPAPVQSTADAGRGLRSVLAGSDSGWPGGWRRVGLAGLARTAGDPVVPRPAPAVAPGADPAAVARSCAPGRRGATCWARPKVMLGNRRGADELLSAANGRARALSSRLLINAANDVAGPWEEKAIDHVRRRAGWCRRPGAEGRRDRHGAPGTAPVAAGTLWPRCA